MKMHVIRDKCTSTDHIPRFNLDLNFFYGLEDDILLFQCKCFLVQVDGRTGCYFYLISDYVRWMNSCDTK